jgi:predicted tellurium resistance membrane protein TerC
LSRTDIVFSIDAVPSAIAFSNKLWVLWTGGIVGIIAMRFASNLFIGLLEKFPRLEDLAYQLVFFVGTKLSLEVFGLELEKGVFWMMMVIIGIIGGSLIYRESKIIGHQKKKTEEIIQDLKSGKLELTTLLRNEKVHAELYRALIRENFIQMTQDQGEKK